MDNTNIISQETSDSASYKLTKCIESLKIIHEQEEEIRKLGFKIKLELKEFNLPWG